MNKPNLSNITACFCHCHHTPSYIGEHGYGMQPNWAECPMNCKINCEHCKPDTTQGDDRLREQIEKIVIRIYKRGHEDAIYNSDTSIISDVYGLMQLFQSEQDKTLERVREKAENMRRDIFNIYRQYSDPGLIDEQVLYARGWNNAIKYFGYILEEEQKDG